MGMFSEITTEANVEGFVKQIERQLQAHSDDENVCRVLRELGRFALTQFEWSWPTWADHYKQLFEEKK